MLADLLPKMTPELLLWLLGHAIVFGGAGMGAYIKLIQRITKVETFISLLGTKAARALHSPDDHLGLDQYLDEYLTKHYEMSGDAWLGLHDKCEAILKDKSVSASERSLAAILSAVCEHKLVVLRPGFKKNSLEQKAATAIIKNASDLK